MDSTAFSRCVRTVSINCLCSLFALLTSRCFWATASSASSSCFCIARVSAYRLKHRMTTPMERVQSMIVYILSSIISTADITTNAAKHYRYHIPIEPPLVVLKLMFHALSVLDIVRQSTRGAQTRFILFMSWVVLLHSQTHQTEHKPRFFNIINIYTAVTEVVTKITTKFRTLRVCTVFTEASSDFLSFVRRSCIVVSYSFIDSFWVSMSSFVCEINMEEKHVNAY